jgi:hypothetical protein
LPEKLPSNRPDFSLLMKLFNLSSIIFALAIIGYCLDRKFHTLPAGTTIGAFLGVLYSFYAAWKVYRQEK